MSNSEKWYKINEDDKVWWLDDDRVGEMVFSFDREKMFNLWEDYPNNLTDEQRKTLEKENPILTSLI
jgi:hypothetical protein